MISYTQFNCTLSIFALLLAGCAPMPVNDHSAGLTTFVVLGEQGQAVARVLTDAAQCPRIRIDGVDVAMDVRAAAGTVAQRTTRSAPADSKPSGFPLLTCEKILPAQTTSAIVAGHALPLPKTEARRIVVIGDTGCRLKKSDQAYQPCNDAAHYPFARIAAAAARWQPDLVIHVGDYHYRENACPDDNAGCAGSSWGYGWDAWRDDFFKPAAPLLQAAPWVLVRGNHESCSRAGQGWWRMLDPRPLQAGRDCNDPANDDLGDFSDPYAVPLGGDAQVIVLDTSNTTGSPIAQDDVRSGKYRAMYRQADQLSQQASYNFGANHQPILGFYAYEDAKGIVNVLPGNQGIQSVFGALNPLIMPARIDALLSGHTHLWQQVSFASAHPTQFIAGFSGTMEDLVPLPDVLPSGATPAPGAIVASVSAWTGGFGYMTMERSGARQWQVRVWDTAGREVNRCQVEGSKSACEKARIQ
ncbi:hypothetical protein IMCC9480_1629 [Oxalobacteraceae bacterium IMCC9480]|nr:hypothetical protein IMCC9480_1629 [Oxalobacteraceae bacterium IMCC9480]